MHFWKSNFPADKATGKNIYAKYRNRFATKKDEEEFVAKNRLEEFIKQLTSEASVYSKIINPDLNDYKRKEKKPEYNALVAINRFKGIQVRVALLSLYRSQTEKKTKVSNTEFNKFLNFLSNFHFATAGIALGVNSNKTTSPYQEFAKSVAKASDKVQVRSAMQALRYSLASLINKEEFISQFKEISFSKKSAKTDLSQYSARYALEQLYMHSENKNSVDDEASVEHIADEDNGDLKNVHSIGNLLLLEENLNQELNGMKQKDGVVSFASKKSIYAKSNYKEAKSFEPTIHVWDDGTIRVRAGQMANEFYTAFLDPTQP